MNETISLIFDLNGESENSRDDNIRLIALNLQIFSIPNEVFFYVEKFRKQYLIYKLKPSKHTLIIEPVEVDGLMINFN